MSTFCIGSISEKFAGVEYRQVSFKRNVHDFSNDYKATDKSDILNIHKYLMFKNIIKWCSDILRKCLLHYCVLGDL